jgi:SH3 domain protein
MNVKQLVLLSLLLPVFAARAEPGYITQSLNVGIHEAASLKSTILQLVPSGTELEVLERDAAGHARIRTADGLEGWVDARYLGQGVPARRRVQELEDELLQTATELAGARDQVAELEFQLNRSLAEAAALQAGGLPPPAAGDGALTSETLRELQTLAEENQKLKQRVAELEAVQAMAIERAPPRTSSNADGHAPAARGEAGFFSRYTAILHWPAWSQILLLCAIVLAFAAGGFLVDWDVRRRHGGFRV